MCVLSWQPCTVPWSAHLHESVDYDEGTVYSFSELEMMEATLKYVSISVPGVSYECSHRNRKNIIYKFTMTYWANKKLEKTFSWITSLLMIRCSVTTATTSQNSSLWSRNMWIPHWSRISRCRSLGKVTCTDFWDRKEEILLDFLELWQTMKSHLYVVMLSWRLEHPESAKRRKQLLFWAW